MAATRLIALHQTKGLSVGETLKARCKYVENPNKTEDGSLITAYGCSAATADMDFVTSRRSYEQAQLSPVRGDVIAYQIRQSFKPGEITPEEANRIGYETAMRFTKGNHAFIVCTHTDRPHIHNHILFDAVDMKHEHKFRNFFFSGIALQRLSDIICLENGLSVIIPRKPSERDQYKYPKYEGKRDIIKADIDMALGKRPKDFEEFLAYLRQQEYEIKRGKHTAIRGKDGKRFIRFRSLGDGYHEEDILKKIAAMNKVTPIIQPQKHKKEFDLHLSIQDIIAKGKGPGYELWAKKYNIKNLAKALIFLQENGIRSYDDLVKKADDSAERFNTLNARIKSAEKRMDEISGLRGHIIDYAKTRDVYAAYRRSGYSRAFLEEHQAEIIKHKAAKDAFEKFEGKEIPSMKDLNAEFQELLSQKRKDYSEYHDAKENMQRYKTAKYDIDRALNQDIERERERSVRRTRSQSR